MVFSREDQIRVIGNSEPIFGQKLARKLGFPTLNFSYSGDIRGVFVACLLSGKNRLPAVASVGPRPSVGSEEILCEVHCFDLRLNDFSFPEKQLYDVFLLAKIRDIKKFKTLKELQKTIADDVEFGRLWYKRNV